MVAITQSSFNAIERVTGGHACITTDHAFIHEGAAFALVSYDLFWYEESGA